MKSNGVPQETESRRTRSSSRSASLNNSFNGSFLNETFSSPITSPNRKSISKTKSKEQCQDNAQNKAPKASKSKPSKGAPNNKVSKSKKGGGGGKKGRKFKLAYTNRKAIKLLSESGNNELSREDLSFLTDDEKLLLSSWGLPPLVLHKYKLKGVTSLFQWQLDCLANEKVLGGTNLLYSAPTSAGKTLVAEILMIKRVLELGKKAIMILPFVSVAREKMYSLQELFSEVGVRVEGFMGSYNPPGGFSQVDIAVCTIEKANSLINRLLEDGGLGQLGTIVVDELHLVGDPNRGYLLELLLTKIRFMSSKSNSLHNSSLLDKSTQHNSQSFNVSTSKLPQKLNIQFNSNNEQSNDNTKSFNISNTNAILPQKLIVQIIGMSATLPNLDLLAKWLGAELVISNFRPVPLVERIKIGGDICDEQLIPIRPVFSDSVPIQIKSDPNDLIYLSLQTVLESHSVLIFCPTKALTESTAVQIAREFFSIGNPTESPYPAQVGEKLRSELDGVKISEILTQLAASPTGLDDGLRRAVRFGVAFHHAGLTYDERDIVESGFKRGILRVLVATSTLSAGVNLPARRVLILTPGFNSLDVLTYRQMSGRAGRKGVDSEGESILICEARTEKRAIDIIQSPLPPVKSTLLGDPGFLTSSMKRALLEVIASGIVVSPAQVEEYAKCTLLSHMPHEDSLTASSANSDAQSLSIENCLKYLESNDFIRLKTSSNNSSSEFMTTQLGSACLASSLSPDEGIVVFKELERARQCFVLENELHVVYQVTPIYVGEQWKNIDWRGYLDIWQNLSADEKKVGSLIGVREGFIISGITGAISWRNPNTRAALNVHQRFYTALALNDLVHEMPVSSVVQKYGVNKGVVQNLQQAASTFAGMVTVFCSRLGWSNLELLLSQFTERLQFGVQRELVDLVRLDLINGLRARILYDGGIKTIGELARADAGIVEELLHKAGPFSSTVHGGQPSKSIWMLGKNEGLSEGEAAEMIVAEARHFIQAELGLSDELVFSKPKNSPEISTSNNANSSKISQKSQNTSTNSTKNKSFVPVIQISELSSSSSSESDLEKSLHFQNENSSKISLKNTSKISNQNSFSNSISNVTNNNISAMSHNSSNSQKITKDSNYVSLNVSKSLNGSKNQEIHEKSIENAENLNFSRDFFEESFPTIDEDEILKTPLNTPIIPQISKNNHLKNDSNFENSPNICSNDAQYTSTPVLNLNSSFKRKNISSLKFNMSESFEFGKEAENKLETSLNPFDDSFIFANFEYLDKSEAKNNDNLVEKLNLNEPIRKEDSKFLILNESIKTCDKKFKLSEPMRLLDQNSNKPIMKFDKFLNVPIRDEYENFNEPITNHDKNYNLNKSIRAENLNSQIFNFNESFNSIDENFNDDKNRDLNEPIRINSEILNLNEPIRSDDENLNEPIRMDDENFSFNEPENPNLNEPIRSDDENCNVFNAEPDNDNLKQPIRSNSTNLNFDKPIRIEDENLNEPIRDEDENLNFDFENDVEMNSSFTSCMEIDENNSANLEEAKKLSKSILAAAEAIVASSEKGGDGNDSFMDSFEVLNATPPLKKSVSLSKSSTDFSSSSSFSDEEDDIFASVSQKRTEFKNLKIFSASITIVQKTFSEFLTILKEVQNEDILGLGLNIQLPLAEEERNLGIGGRVLGRNASLSPFHRAKKLKTSSSPPQFISIFSPKRQLVYRTEAPRLSDVLIFLNSSPQLNFSLVSTKETIKILVKEGKFKWDGELVGKFPNFLDPLIGEWLLNFEEDGKISADEIWKTYFTKDEIRKLKNSQWPSEAIDALSSFKLMEEIKERLISSQLWKHFIEIEMKSIYPILQMELNGFHLDSVEFLKIKNLIESKAALLELRAYQLASRPFNLASSREIRQILFTEIGLKSRSKSRIGSTSKEVLSKIDHELPKIILEWRKLHSALQKVIIPFSQENTKNRLSGTYTHLTTSGRFIMSEPSLQCIPRDFTLSLNYNSTEIEAIRHGTKYKFHNKIPPGLLCKIEEIGKDDVEISSISLRRAFTASSEEFSLLSADYSQLELRILAHLANERKLGRILNTDSGDVFRKIASIWKKVGEKCVSGEMRQEAKSICYGIIYGMGSKALGEQMGIDEEEAKSFKKLFLDAFPGIEIFIRKTIEECEINGYVETLSGRRRYLPNINSRTPIEKAQAQRQAVNYKIQGSASELVKTAMIKIQTSLSKLFPDSGSVVPILNLHDELIYEVNKNLITKIGREIKDIMEEGSSELRVKLKVVIKTGPNWGSLTPIEI